MGPTYTTTVDDGKADEPVPKLQVDVTYNCQDYTIIREGLAEILNPQGPSPPKGPKSAKNVDVKPQAVFYNPIQQFNRDLSVLAIRVFGEDLAVLRRERAERRSQNLPNDGQRGKKRKRGKGEGGDMIQNKGEGLVNGMNSESAIQDPLNSANGTSNSGLQGDTHSDTQDQASYSVGDERGSEAQIPAIDKKQRLDNDLITAKPVIGPVMGEDTFELVTPTTPEALVHSTEAATSTKSATSEILAKSETHVTSLTPMTEKAFQRESGQRSGADNDAEDSTKGPVNLEETEARAKPPARPTRFRILDALSATGLRAIRYAKEIPMTTSVTANDLSPSATASIEVNVQHNNLSNRINPTTGNALAHMYGVGLDQYEVIDLDPYGTAAPFFDAAVQAVNDGGLLCVTCTDSGVFASVGYLEKTFSQYGGLPLKGPQSHEGGLRLILHGIATSAARYGLAIEPLLSLSIDFYARVFVRILRSPAEVKLLAGKTMIVYNCDEGCGAWTTQYLAQTREKKDKKEGTFFKFSLAQAPSATPHCEHCGFITHLSGPMWGGPLHNPYFIQRILDLLPSLDHETYATIPRIQGMLSLALHESLDDPPPSPTTAPITTPLPRLPPSTLSHHPFFLNPSNLAKVLHCIAPSDAALRGALSHLGYRTTRSHTKAGSIRTDAPWSVVWEIMREWVRQKAPVKEGAIKPGTAGWGIMRLARSGAWVTEARKEIKDVVDRSEGLDELKVGVEAVLYRAQKAAAAAAAASEAQEDTILEEKEILKSQRPEAESSSSPSKQPQIPHHDDDDDAAAATGAPPWDVDVAPSKLRIVFDEKLGREMEGPLGGKRKGGVRYQVNPRKDWGPMNRAKGS
ncbi:RNA methyltransferase tRNA(m5U54)methyltransferase [Toensbergia leucococca]|nr:RNA methyltransferase tRNA(m5U54)methyltransferase [Toensbergia leucococca]